MAAIDTICIKSGIKSVGNAVVRLTSDTTKCRKVLFAAPSTTPNTESIFACVWNDAGTPSAQEVEDYGIEIDISNTSGFGAVLYMKPETSIQNIYLSGSNAGDYVRYQILS